MKALIINLESQTEKCLQVLNEAAKLKDIQCEIMPAIYDTNPLKGCTLSHLKCVEYAKENKLEFILILEDDVIFEDNVNEVLKKSLHEIQQFEWNILYLGGLIKSHSKIVTPNLIHAKVVNTTHAYIIHKRFYDIVLNLDMNIIIDKSYRMLSETHPMYMCNPMVAYQRPGYSLLQKKDVNYKNDMITHFKNNVTS
jgi:GR25 family glycosyltransferase involved in LPS biosynthesis